jgi:hypothetical protein
MRMKTKEVEDLDGDDDLEEDEYTDEDEDLVENEDIEKDYEELRMEISMRMWSRKRKT